jgi:ABC-2 type transport system permease protein
VGLLLEGKFRSFYDNRVPPSIIDSKMIDFKNYSKETQMVVFSDGDIIKNQLHYSRGFPLPLGYDQFTRQTYGNKDLILNTINYLTNDQGILSARAKDFKIRLMDQTKIEDNRILIQIINTLVPVLLVIIIGLVQAHLRRKRYTVK